MVSLIIFSLLLAASLPAQGGSLSRNIRYYNPAFSARFLPMSITMTDSLEKRRFLQVFSKIPRDSVSHITERGGKLRITRNLMCRLLEQETDLSLSPVSQFTRLFKSRVGLTLTFPRFSAKGFIPTDPYFSTYQWNLLNTGQKVLDKAGKPGQDINITPVWEQFSGNDSLVIAVVDAGVNLYHPELKNRIWRNPGEYGGVPGVDDDGNGLVDDTTGWDFVENDGLPMDYDGHGTAVASVMVAEGDNTEGLAGILARGKILPIRVLGAAGSGEYDIIARGIRYAVELGVDVINFSIGGNRNSKTMQRAFAEAEKQGIPVVISAGNEGMDIDANPIYPASYSFQNIYTVASHDNEGELSAFSNYGKKSVHFAAPGEIIAAATIPDKIMLFAEDFEDGADKWEFYKSGDFSISGDSPIDSNFSLSWQSGRNTFFTTREFIDLSGQVGAVLTFRLDYIPGNIWDVVIVEGNRYGSAVWEEISVISERVPPNEVLNFSLQAFEGAQFKFRFRTLSLSFRLGRTFTVDNIAVRVCDPAPASYNYHKLTTGTSIAAPHVAAYLGLLRLACDRTGRTLDRQTALAGAVSEPALKGGVQNGARLDIARGLDFYLKTLPKIVMKDSAKKDWTSNDTVVYLAALDGGAPQQYTLKLLDDNSRKGAAFDGGRFTFTEPDSGSYQLDFRAEGPTLLRYRLGFSVTDKSMMTQVSSSAMGSTFFWDGDWYALPAAVVRGDILQITGFDAAGRLRKSIQLKLDERPRPEEQVAGGTGPLFYRLSVNGQTLTRVSRPGN